MKPKQNCWEYMECGREPDGVHAKELGTCPAAIENHMHGVHGGINAGRCCWVVTATLCNGEVQGVFAGKYSSCKDCGFYKLVKAEEYPNFLLSPHLLAGLKKAKAAEGPPRRD